MRNLLLLLAALPLAAQTPCYSTPESSVTIHASGTTAFPLQILRQTSCAFLFPPAGRIISNDSWITVRDDVWFATGTSGVFVIAVAANGGAPRVGTITAGNLTFIVRQLGASTPLPITGPAVPQLSALDAKMTALLREFNIPGGSLAVAYQGRLVYARGFGYADLSTLEPVQPDSMFRLASVSKLMTIAATNLLYSGGQLTPNTSVVNTLQLSPPAGQSLGAGWSGMTAGHLLDMKGGFLTSNLDRALDRNYLASATTALGIPLPGDNVTRIRYALGQPTDYTPGSPPAACGGNTFNAPCYSNFGYQILGRVIEKVTGKTYENYVRDSLMAPAGVTRIRAARSFRDQNHPGEVRYYGSPSELFGTSSFSSPTGGVPWTYGAYVYETADAYGGMVASAPDLLRFYRRWVNGYYFYGSLPGTSTQVFFYNNPSYDTQVAILFNVRNASTRTNTATCTQASPCDITLAAQKDVQEVLGAVSSWPSGDLFPTYSTSAPACTISVGHPTVVAPAVASTVTVNVTAPDGCGWSGVSETASWLGFAEGKFTTASTGNGTIGIQVAANTGAARSGNVIIGGQTVTVNQQAVGTGGTVTAPSEGQTVSVSAVSFAWTQDTAATGYDLRVTQTGGQTVYSGQLAGTASNNAVISLPAGSFTFNVQSCTGGGFTQCTSYPARNFTVQLPAPSSAPQIQSPASGATLTTSTNTLRWTAVTGATSYQVSLRNNTTNTTDLFIVVFAPSVETIFSMRSGQYTMEARACTTACGPPATVNFTVQLPAVPAQPPSIANCTVTSNAGQNSLACNWNAVAGADLYVLQVVQPPPAGPGGGALTVAAGQVSTTSASFLVPNGSAVVFVQACNGDGCSPVSAGFNINPQSGNPNLPALGQPVSGLTVEGPTVLFTWNRIPGDNGSNTTYRVFVQDFARQQPALDVLTTQNFWAAQFAAGRRFDVLIVANPASANPVTGPASGFTTRGASPTSPTLVAPQHQGRTQQGNVRLAWTPLPGGQLYQYYVSRQGAAAAVATGVTAGLEVQVPLSVLNNADTAHTGIVRVCNNGLACVATSETGWGPWSNTPGGTGVTSFTLTP